VGGHGQTCSTTGAGCPGGRGGGGDGLPRHPALRAVDAVAGDGVGGLHFGDRRTGAGAERAAPGYGTVSPQRRGVSGMRLGMVLALFSFVGFESATALGAEARNPLRTIPRAVLQSAIGLGVLFVVCAYAEVMGFRGLPTTLVQSAAPFHVLAQQMGVSALGVAVDGGATLSMFACVLACITAAARVLLLMAYNGLTPAGLSRTHDRNETP